MTTALRYLGDDLALAGNRIQVGSGESLYSIELRPGLTAAEIEDALTIIRWLKGSGPFYGIAGLMLVTGMPRQGKGLFGNTLACKIMRYFKGKKIIRDDHPAPLWKELLGPYTFFNEDVLAEDLARMKEVAANDIPEEAKTAKKKVELQRDMAEWKSTTGEVLFQNSIAMFDEFWRWMNNRRPMSPMNLALSGMIKMWGHLDMLMMGMAQRQHDLDQFTCLPYVTHEVRCVWCKERIDTTRATLYRVQYSNARRALVPIDKPTTIYLDGGRLREELGGKSYFDLYRSKAAPSFQFGSIGSTKPAAGSGRE